MDRWWGQSVGRHGVTFGAFVIWRVALALAMCGAPTVLYFVMQAIVTREAALGRAFEIRPPDAPLVLATAGLGVLSLAGWGVVAVLLTRPREGPAAALLHDWLQVVLLGGCLALFAGDIPLLAPEGRLTLGLAAMATGLFAAEGVWLCARAGWASAGAALALAYAACAWGLHALAG